MHSLKQDTPFDLVTYILPSCDTSRLEPAGHGVGKSRLCRLVNTKAPATHEVPDRKIDLWYIAIPVKPESRQTHQAMNESYCAHG